MSKHSPTYRHGHSFREGRPSKVYKAWQAMKYRCLTRSCVSYSDYGGRGIAVCEEWVSSFEKFLADVGEPPSSKHSLERIDNDGDYTPGNVRWAEPTEQNRNQRKTKLTQAKAAEIRKLVSKGVSQKEVARLFGVGPTTVSHIVRGKQWL